MTRHARTGYRRCGAPPPQLSSSPLGRNYSTINLGSNVFQKITLLFFAVSSQLFSQSSDSTDSIWHLFSENKAQVSSAFEVESLFPMFFYGGYHFGIGYRFSDFRIRASVIKGGTYDVEPNGINNSKDSFERYYAKPGYGIFFGYNIWQNWDFYTYIERHTFGITQKASSQELMLYSTDFGFGTSYQLFIGKWFYLQPGVHFYFRGSQSVQFTNGQDYSIPQVDISPVIRAGIRIWQIDK